MANNLIENPIGLNAIVNRLQTVLYDPLKTKWSVTQLDGYPICYIKEKDKVRTIEHFESGIEYSNLIYAEKNKFWFTAETPTLVKDTFDRYQSQISLYFTVNLQEIKPSIEHRADNEARQDVLEILEQQGAYVRIVNVITGIDNVYKGFTFNKADDLQPYHCFKIVLNAYSFRQDLVIC